MDGLRSFCKTRRCGDKIVFVVTLAAALVGIAALATGCGSAKESDAGITFVKVHPDGQTLQKGATSIVGVKKNLGFVVGVENVGPDSVKNLEVTLLIDQSPQPIRSSRTIDQLSSGQATDVVFKGPFAVTEMVTKVPIKVSITPGAGDKNRSNNSATYEVRFVFLGP
jgi:hypothetical protein